MAINVFVKGGVILEEVSATADKVLSGYTYNDSDGEVQTGTMANKGTIVKFPSIIIAILFSIIILL